MATPKKIPKECAVDLAEALEVIMLMSAGAEAAESLTDAELVERLENYVAADMHIHSAEFALVMEAAERLAK